MQRDDSEILVIDDETRGVELMARALRKLGTVTTMTDSGEGLAAALATHYDLVISDQRMPGITGVEILSVLARQAPDTGRILLTGFADLTATKTAINEAQVHAYLSKPCPPDQLRTVASNVIERVRLATRNTFLVAQLKDQTDELEEVVASLKRECVTRETRARFETATEISDRALSYISKLDSSFARLDDASKASSHKVRAAKIMVELRDYFTALKAQ